ncbi:hypothetical protein JQX13_46255 [Archangium violaceum]|uniref:hypothetical protein n=1 Tax=Archangium violaceum TaxID=83451 RepID=UPI00193C82A1|nr:hypothetical protein [Archangium violaceum]QRK07359.1 hypothetical protein JQX13_46255 [Archangium violaceum]
MSVSPDGGTLLNVVLAKGASEKLDVAFAINAGAAPGLQPVLIKQLSGDGKTEIGGVRWDINVLSLDAPAVAPSLSATRNAQGLVELAWTHTAHHKLYRVWRVDPAVPTAAGQIIAEISGAGALETTALRFVDRESAGRAFQYVVESLSGSGTTASSEQVTADATGN